MATSPYPPDRNSAKEGMEQGDWSESLQQESTSQESMAQEHLSLRSRSTPEEPPSSSERNGCSTRAAKRQRRGKNSPEPDYSAIVQEQMSTTNRTGQACDRCKGRKMKCDSNATGCANCIASDSTCTQTDPITKVSSIRGELERLRQDNATLQRENEDLREALDQSNVLLRGYQRVEANGQGGTMGVGQLPPPLYSGGYLNGGSTMGGTSLPPFQQPQTIQPNQGFGGDLFRNGNSLGLPHAMQHPDDLNGYRIPHTGSNTINLGLPRLPSTTLAPPQQQRGSQYDQRSDNPPARDHHDPQYPPQQQWPY